jgi:hypothetical protein
MDMKEASAMTEASGLVSEHASDARPIGSASQDIAIRCAERLCKVTIEAPMLSLFVAFLFGIWIARRG